MKRSLGSHLTLLAVVGIGSVLAANVAQATQFDQAEIEDQETRMMVMASPIGTTGNYKLLIFEQLNNRRQCWGEIGSSPTVIDPLFMQFDFTGICGRSTDSNAYSVRVAGQDLVGRYNLRLVRRENELVLIGFSLLDRDVEFFEIGRTRGLAEGMLKIELDPGWRLTRRSFRGKPVGHIYLTTDRSLPELANRATPIAPEAPAPLPQPIPAPVPPSQPGNPAPSSLPAPQPEPTPQASPAPTGNYVVPLVPQSATPIAPTAAPKSLPSNWNSRPSSSVVVPVMMPPAPTMATPTENRSPNSPNSMATAGFRVVVDLPSPEQQTQIRQLVPGAFRTTLNGQSVLQVGVFRDRAIANSLQQQLASQNVNARIVPTSIAAVPQSAPINPVRPPLPIPNSSGSAFNLPQPTAAAQLTPTLLWSTYYYTHRAEAAFNPSMGTYPLLDREGNNLGISLSHRDWCAAALQGSVQITNNQQILGTYNFGGRGETAQVDCSLFYPRLRTLADTNRVRFRRSNTLYGEGVGGNSLVPYRTIAVDRTRIPIGSVVYIPDARGTLVTLPSGQQAVHDGYFYAADVGAAIKNNQIDVFIGVAERNPFRFIKSNPSGTFTAYVINDPRLQALLASEHRAGAVAAR